MPYQTLPPPPAARAPSTRAAPSATPPTARPPAASRSGTTRLRHTMDPPSRKVPAAVLEGLPMTKVAGYKPQDEPEAGPIHRIRITLTSRTVKNLEKGGFGGLGQELG